MKIKYFEDTDTALLEFSNADVVETREIDENLYADMDANGNVVSLTIEHAKKRADLPNVVVERLGRGAA